MFHFLCVQQFCSRRCFCAENRHFYPWGFYPHPCILSHLTMKFNNFLDLLPWQYIYITSFSICFFTPHPCNHYVVKISQIGRKRKKLNFGGGNKKKTFNTENNLCNVFFLQEPQNPPFFWQKNLFKKNF